MLCCCCKVVADCRRLVRSSFLCLLRTLPSLTTHLVGVLAVVTHHLKALVWNVLRDCRDEIARGEDFYSFKYTFAEIRKARSGLPVNRPSSYLDNSYFSRL